MVELVYPDGSVELVERCVGLLYGDDPDDTRMVFVAQRAPGQPLMWLKPEQLANINVEVGTGPAGFAPGPKTA